MKKMILAAALLPLLSTVAFAADLPNTKGTPAYVPPLPPSWTGFYLNAGIGYGEWSGGEKIINPVTQLCDNCVDQIQGGRGFLGRAGAGFDYQFTNRFVGGVFGDATLSSMRGTIQDGGPYLSGSTNENWSWAAGARLGWLVTPQLLAYGNAGFTQTHFTGTAMQSSFDGSYTGVSTQGVTANGWFVGAGFEEMFAPGWFWRTEYRFADYGTRTLSEIPGGDDIRFRPLVQTVTSGIVYKFGWPGMVPPAIPSVATLFSGFGPVETPASNWTGLYADAGIGYGMWSANTTILDSATGFCLLCNNQRQGGRGVAGTIGIGYDYQLTNKIVAGVFGDFDPTGIRGTIQDQNPTTAGNINENWSWAAGARLGWLVTPQILTYTEAGFTEARFGGTQMLGTDGTPSGDTTGGFTTNGWLLGAGVEAMVAPGWFIRGEYRYSEFGSHTIAEFAADGTSNGDSIHFRPETQTATIGLVYKFNWAPAAPAVVSKY